jgi:hypothetical protein
MFEQAPRQANRLSFLASSNTAHAVTLMKSIGTSTMNPGREIK